MIVVLLPAFNEEDSVFRVMTTIIEILEPTADDYRIVVCNDGSTDRTQEILERFIEGSPVEVLQHPINRGLGETIRDLFERAIEITSTQDFIVRLDCDNTHGPEYIPSIIAQLRDGCDVVIASRFAPGGGQRGVGRYRAVVSYMANLLMKIVFPIPGVREYSCGFRGYRASKLKEAMLMFSNNFIQLKGLGFTCTLEKLIKLKLLGARFGEVPFVLRYDKKTSYSKMVTSVTSFGYLALVILYYWPWGGWRENMRRKRRSQSYSHK